jgi:hypothetical protein
MSFAYFPWGILIFLGVRLLLRGEKEKTKSCFNGNLKPYYPNKPIQYFVNGKCIEKPHHLYYLEKLDLINCNTISDQTIMDTAKTKIINEMKQSDQINTSTLEILAARDYLLDQWCYVVWKN